MNFNYFSHFSENFIAEMAKNKCFRLIFFLSSLILLKTMTAIFGAFVPSNSTRSDPSSEAEITSVEEDDSFVYFLQDGIKCSIYLFESPDFSAHWMQGVGPMSRGHFNRADERLGGAGRSLPWSWVQSHFLYDFDVHRQKWV